MEEVEREVTDGIGGEREALIYFDLQMFIIYFSI